MSLTTTKENNKKLSSHFEQYVVIEDNGSITKKRNKNLLENIHNQEIRESVVASLSGDLGVILANEFEDLPTHKLSFKAEIKKIFNKIIDNLINKNEKIVFLDIQFYYLFIMKKLNENIDVSEWFLSEQIESIESKATNKIISKFNENGNKEKTIKIEYIDVLFVFFPNNSMKKSLKEMGFYDL